jgi:23S rRNA pseudouridine1911/1915/1917 synthase
MPLLPPDQTTPALAGHSPTSAGDDPHMTSRQQRQVGPEEVGKRLDAYLSEQFRDYSRGQLRGIIETGHVQVNGQYSKPAYRMRLDDLVEVELPDLPPAGPLPEDIDLEILFQDEYLAAINKPPGMVVHPARGHWSGTLTCALAFHFQELSSLGGTNRPGVVHRLDRDTSGVILVAKSDQAHAGLAAQFEARTTEKEYLAIVRGLPDRDRDLIDKPIGRHPYQREKMAIRAQHSTSREARTFYEVVERFPRHALVRVAPQTGRTHQIRVHLAHVGCPILCDRLYAGHAQVTRQELEDGREGGQVLLDRQALHAWRIALRHPVTGERLQFEAPLPGDLERVLQRLRESGKSGG